MYLISSNQDSYITRKKNYQLQAPRYLLDVLDTIRVVTPTTALIPTELAERAEKLLSYVNRSAAYQLGRHKHMPPWRKKQLGEEYSAEERRLKERAFGNLLFDGQQGFWTYSGLAGYLGKALGVEISYELARERIRPLPWRREPPPLRAYQQEALKRVLDAPPPASVSVGTGLGKSLLAVHFVREVGGKSLVVAPTANIADQLLRAFQEAFGDKEVGPYFDGDKMPRKRVVVGTFQSLARVSEHSEHWQLLAGRDSMVVDESHMTPAETLRKVCMGLAAETPWRLFQSGTQTRGDGQELVLRGVIGDPVYSMTVREGVEQGFLAQPNFHMLRVRSGREAVRGDSLDQERHHLYRNPDILGQVAALADGFAADGWRVLTLVREVETAALLAPHLTTSWELARGSEDRVCKLCRGDKRKRVGCEGCSGTGAIRVLPEKPMTDPTLLVERFNRGDLPHLVGTSCIGVGTDIRPPGPMAIFWLGGGKSEVEFPQAVGRGTRRQGKDEFWFWDVDVANVADLHERADARRAMMADIWAAPTEVTL